MSDSHEASVKRLRRRPSKTSLGHRSSPSINSDSSTPPSPTRSPSPSPRAIKISEAFELVLESSASVQILLSKPPSEPAVTLRNRIKEFQDGVARLFDELQRLPENVPLTPALVSAIQGCSFEVHCFASSAEAFRVGLAFGGGEGEQREDQRRKELLTMLTGAVASACVLLELAAQAIEEAEAERTRLNESVETDVTKAEMGSRFDCLGLDGRPLSWLAVRDVNDRELRNLERQLPSLPSTPTLPVYTRKEPLIPTKRPSKGKYDVRHLRKSIHFHLDEGPPPLRDSMAMIGDLAPFPTDLPSPDPADLDAPHVEYDFKGDVKKANLRGLVGVVTSGSAIEHEEFVSMVLTTFRLFASGEKLADALYSRYVEERPEWLARKGKMRFEWSMAQARMKSRVGTVLHLWMELYWKPEDCRAIPRLKELIGAIEEDCVFHSKSLRMSLDRIVEDEDGYLGKRFRTEERYRPTTVSPPPTSFKMGKDLVVLAERKPSELTVGRFASPEGVEEFARMITMVESRYYRKLSPEDIVHHKSEQTLRIRKELGDFEQRYKAWIVWTIVTPEDPEERARVIEFWFGVAKICVQYRNFNTAHQIKCVLGDPEFEKMRITRQVLEKLNKNAIVEFWKVCRLYENEGWWSEMNSSSLAAVPVSYTLIRWRIYIEECGLRELCKETRDVRLSEFKNNGRIEINTFMNLADLIWDIERTYEPHTLNTLPWVESWFLSQVFSPQITDFGLETQHFRTGVAKDNPIPRIVPDTVLAKLVTALEARLQRKKTAKLIPLVPRKKVSVELISNKPGNKLRKRRSTSSGPSPSESSRPGTPTSQSFDSQTQQRPQNKLRKRSRGSSIDSLQGSPPELVQDFKSKVLSASEVVIRRSNSQRAGKQGPPPSPSHRMRFMDEGRSPERRRVGVSRSPPLFGGRAWP